MGEVEILGTGVAAIVLTWGVVRFMFRTPTPAHGGDRGGGKGVAMASHPPLIHKLLDYRAERARMVLDAQVKLGMAAQTKQAVVKQVAAHSVPQSHSNQVANYVDPAPVTPFVDEFRNRVLVALVSVYEGDRMAADGRILVTAPWSKRGGFTRLEAERAVRMFGEAAKVNAVWAAEVRNNAWYVNRKQYPTAGRLVRAFNEVKTPA